MMAVIRNGYLWTCHHVGLNSLGSYSGSADRSGAQWFQLQVGAAGLAFTTKGRLFDSSGTPYSYYFPSLNVAPSGNLLVAFSGSKSGENVGAFFQARKANGTWMNQPTLVQAGRDAYRQNRWGDYSATTVDPDGIFWTIQEHASYNVGFPDATWGTWIMQVSP
jgi:hypothetical protein